MYVSITAPRLSNRYLMRNKRVRLLTRVKGVSPARPIFAGRQQCANLLVQLVEKKNRVLTRPQQLTLITSARYIHVSVFVPLIFKVLIAILATLLSPITDILLIICLRDVYCCSPAQCVIIN